MTPSHAARLLALRDQLVREADNALIYASDTYNIIEDIEDALLRILPVCDAVAS